jgi:hypothetical protein
MDFAPVLNIFRLVAAEFSAITDDVVLSWIELTSPLVSKRRFRNLWAQAFALLTAHRMKMANVGVDASVLPGAAEISVARQMGVANYSEGEVSIGFDTNLASLTGADADLALTTYGIEYLSLRRMRIVPITSAGEPNARS